jgi:Abnormal spindle-like microcephaly-assoc'd, ASPM-SPD-2-Hydin
MSHLPARLNAFLVVIALASLVGCQGFSSGKSNSQTLPGALTAAPTSVTFGNVQVGTSQIQSDTLANTGGSSLTITQSAVTGAGFTTTGLTLPLTLAVGQSVTFSVVFNPQATGSVSGSLALTNSASTTPLSIALAGTGVAAGGLTESPASFTFGNVQVGLSQNQNETLNNVSAQSVTISQVTFTGTGFSATGLTLPLTLAPNQSTTFAVVFTPTTVGAANGTLAITASGSSTALDFALSGIGVAPATLTASPASLTFTNIQVGQTSSQTETLQNTGGENATISAATITGTGFSISGITTPLTLTPGQSSSFSVTYSPLSAGSASGSVTIASNASNAALSVTLAGTAVTSGSLTGSPTSFSFGNVQVGLNQSQTETVKNSGGASLTVSAATFTGTGFSATGLTLPLTLAPNQSSTFAVVFTPTTATAVSGNLAFTVSGSSTPLNLPLSGTGVAPATLTATPTSLTFTNILVGQNQSQTETIQNTGGENATISQATVAGTGLSISGLTTPLTLTPGQSTSFSVTFTPLSAGSVTGSVMVDSNATDAALSVALSGTSITQSAGTLSATAVNTGSVVVGTSGTQTGTLTATGASVSVTSVSLSGTNPSEFSITGLTFPVTVTTTTPVTFTVKFTPSSSGAASATASFASNATNTPNTASLTGTGTAAPVHSVSLTWTASTTTGITSYNVYRAVYASSVCGSYSNIGSTASTVTAYTDSVVTDGTTYCYATTAVDSGGESAYSNVVQAAIPAP